MNYILSARSFKKIYTQKIKALSPDWSFVCAETLPPDFDWSSVVVTIGWKKDWEEHLFNEHARLKWVQSISAGVDMLPLKDFSERNILLSNGSGIHTQSISDHVLGTILMKSRGLFTSMIQQNQHNWQPETITWQNVSEMTILVVGTGKIGQEIARKLSFLGAKMIGINTNGRPIENFKACYPFEQLNLQIKQADIIVNSLPLTKDTLHIFNQTFFKEMKPEGGFINIGRGPSVDEKALSSALTNGDISFAAIDVAEKEPLPDDHYLWNTPNLMITPHISGMTPHFQKLFMAIFLMNFEEFLANRSLKKNSVNLQSGY